MKKAIFLFALLLTFNVVARAQTEKGNWMVGADVANLDYQFESDVFTINLVPQAGYFVSDNLAVGAMANLGIITGGETVTIFGLGPFIRGYFGSTGKGKFFGQGNVGFSGVSVRGDTATQFDAGATLGYAWFLNRSVALETGLGYSYTKPGSFKGLSDLGLRFGFQIHLPGKKAL